MASLQPVVNAPNRDTSLQIANSQQERHTPSKPRTPEQAQLQLSECNLVNLPYRPESKTSRQTRHAPAAALPAGPAPARVLSRVLDVVRVQLLWGQMLENPQSALKCSKRIWIWKLRKSMRGLLRILQRWKTWQILSQTCRPHRDRCQAWQHTPELPSRTSK